jgi:SAM-dependent methyltransferase
MRILTPFSFFVLLLFFQEGCVSTKSNQSRYINNDSTGLFSTHPSRPFKYGYAYNKEECSDGYKSLFLDLGLKKGDVVADIGAASGWIEGIFSVFSDSITYYVEDIDTNYANESQLKKVVDYYSNVRGSPQTNKFYFVTGTKTTTNLQDGMFDKIIMNNSYHEIKAQQKILKEVLKKLKPDGKLIIADCFSNKYTTYHIPGCGYKAESMKKIKDEVESAGYFLIDMSEPENSFSNILTFERDRHRTVPLYDKINSVQPFIEVLDKLNDVTFAEDSDEAKDIGVFLEAHLEQLTPVYRSLEDYLSSLGYEWIDEKLYPAALNVMQIWIKLYPNSADAYYGLGQVYLKSLNYPLALINFNKALKLEPDDRYIQRAISQVKSTH